MYGIACRVLVGKPEEMRLPGRPRRRMYDTRIIKEIRLKRVDGFVRLTAGTN
jgi:hypothetical protein